MRIKKEPVANAGAPGNIIKQTRSAAKALCAAMLVGTVAAGKNVGQALSMNMQPEGRFVSRTPDNKYKLVKGKLILRNPNTGRGYEPDGDSVRFHADNQQDMLDKKLFNLNATRVDLAGGVFQLRFEEIDATELHYRQQAQPLGAWARDQLLAKCGFTNVVYGPDGMSVIGCDKWEIEAYILFKGYDVYGRPICYVFIGKPPAEMKSDDGWINLTTAQLKESLNYEMLIQGVAYLTIYTSSPEDHRQVLISAAKQAQKAKLGVWAMDRTNEFTFKGLASVGTASTVAILPKIFRRLVDYVLDGGSETMKFPAWLLSTETTKKNRNDVVIIGTERKKLSDLVTHVGNVIKIDLNLFECVFEEQEPVHPIVRAVRALGNKMSSMFRASKKTD
jgi:endonuclease YncB( thermonuclease family)